LATGLHFVSVGGCKLQRCGAGASWGRIIFWGTGAGAPTTPGATLMMDINPLITHSSHSYDNLNNTESTKKIVQTFVLTFDVFKIVVIKYSCLGAIAGVKKASKFLTGAAEK
jgi:hypothetical protein